LTQERTPQGRRSETVERPQVFRREKIVAAKGWKKSFLEPQVLFQEEEQP
jgi:hypothetical protein